MGSPTEWNYTSQNTRCKRRSDWPALNFGRGAGASRQNVIIIQPLPPWFIPVSRAAAFLFVGTWLSLVEHSLGVRGVGSSNLPVPTNKFSSGIHLRVAVYFSTESVRNFWVPLSWTMTAVSFAATK